jgi:hypothetical protein
LSSCHSVAVAVLRELHVSSGLGLGLCQADVLLMCLGESCRNFGARIDFALPARRWRS